jgi:ribosomal protein L37E
VVEEVAVMSRVSLIEKLYVKRKSAFEFDYDALMAPPILSILSITDVGDLNRIATSLKYSGNMDKKYKLIDEVMTRRGFRKAHCGTNRVVYNFLELPTFVAKVALDRVGMTDSPAEFKNQEFFKPFCCKIFETDPTGTIAFVERVNPISSREEFLSVADDIFNLLITKVIGKYVVDDLGSDTYMNFGIRQLSGGCTFGPVIIDFPYAYELDGAKLMCARDIDTPFGKIKCGGEIDYDAGFNHLVCSKCGKVYTAMDLKKKDCSVIMFGKNKEDYRMRTKVVSGDKVILDSGRESETYITQEEYSTINNNGRLEAGNIYPVKKVIKKKYKSAEQKRRDFHTELQKKHFKEVKANEITKPIHVANPVNYEPETEDMEYGTIISGKVVPASNITKEIEEKILPELDQNYEPSTPVVPVNDEEKSVVAEEDNSQQEEISPEMEAFAKGYEDELHRNIDDADTDTATNESTENEAEQSDDAVENSTEDDQSTESESTDDEDPSDNSEYLAEQAASIAEELINNADSSIEVNDEIQSEEQVNNDVDLSNITTEMVGSAVESDYQDYSNYIPPEEEEEENTDEEDYIDPKYADEIEKFNRTSSKKKNKKDKKPSARNIRKHSSRYAGYGEDDDMSEY